MQAQTSSGIWLPSVRREQRRQYRDKASRKRRADRAKPPTFELVHLQLCTIHVCSSERSQSCYAGQIDAADFVQRFGPDSPEPPRSPGQEPRQLGFPGSRDSGRLGDITARTCGPSVPCVESRRAYFQIRFLQAEEA